jgi:hypothetical protein
MIEEMSTGLWHDEREQDCNRDLYNSRPSREYHPNLNAPAVQSDEYLTNTDWESHHIQHSNNPQLFHPFPDTDPVEQPFTYEKSKKMSEFFLSESLRATDQMSVALFNLIIEPKIKVQLRDFAAAIATIICTANQPVVTHRASSDKTHYLTAACILRGN